METIKTDKTFDAVKTMREIRNKISTETDGMSLAELKKYIQKQKELSGFKAIGQ